MAEVEDFSLRQSKRRRVDTGLPRNTYGQSQTLARMVNGNGVADSNQVLRRLLKPSNNQDGMNSDGDRMNGDDSLSASMLNKSKHNTESEECGGQGENGMGYSHSEDSNDCQLEDNDNLDNKENGEEINRSLAEDDNDESGINGASKGDDKCNQSGNTDKPEESVMAKRARVENIVTSMRQSPSQLGSDGKNNHANETRRQKRKQNTPQPQRVFVEENKKEGGRKEEKRQLKQLLTQLQDHLNTLQHKYFELYDNDETDSEMEEAVDGDGGKVKKGGQSSTKSHKSESKDFQNQRNTGKATKMCNNDDNVQSKAEDAIINGGEQERFSDVLKNELASAVTEVVDSVVKKFVTEQQYNNSSQSSSPAPQDEACNLTIAHENHCQSFPGRMNRSPPHSQYSRVSPTIHQDSMYQSEQTEAIPLVVPHKNRDRPSRENTPRIESQHHHEYEPAVPATLPTSVAIPNPSLQYSLLPHMGVSISDTTGTPELSMGAIYSSVPMNSMLHSHSMLGDSRHPLQGLNHRDLTHSQPEGLPLSLLKPEPLAESSPRSHDYSMDVSSFTSSSGACLSTTLTPAHLKKAKLMFFYARYPSSTVLKQHFPDVKFNRHNTAQLIKWFSNFREFYYIQMEKFARQSLSEGIKNPEMLTVTRDSELFKVLNLHYNKSNEFEVQDNFLIVCRKTLIEFFNAIKAGKDSDASWKKAIYKIISKLDDPLPEFFRSPDCLEELERLER